VPALIWKADRHISYHLDNWSIDIMLELFKIIRAGYGSETTNVVERITGRKPIPFAQFARDYAEAFR
jgi:hypothetical protein